jgi:Mn-dependent DtxR family transcriptional regulator
MNASNIPADVRRFLLAVIESVPHLEALLLLRADPQASWDSDAMAARLYIDEPSASRLLTDLQRHRLVQHETGHWRFDARDAEIARIVDRLAGVYARHVVEVAELIHSTSDRKAQRFADAFRWRKET